MTVNTPSTRQPVLTSFLRLLATPPIGPLIFLIFICALFAILPVLRGEPQRFFTVRNLALIFQQTAIIGVLAIGQTMVILTSGIDLSNGLIMALVSVITAGLAVRGIPLGETTLIVNPIVAIFVGLAVGGFCGWVNGTLVTRLKLPPFIVTLGTLNIIFALTRIYTTATINGLPEPLLVLGNSIQLGDARIPLYALVALALYFITWFVLSQTRLGRHIYAIGDNAEAAALVGIPVNRILLFVYTAAGFLYAIAAILLIARQENGDPQAGQSSNLESITAVVLGGTSLFGGRGHIMGTLIGVLVITVIRNGLTQQGANPIIQTLITGGLVIAAVAVDQLSQRGK
ncbi:MAG: ABC transporter permease [Phototrophicaceae bacterium]